jgi:hypothetical protein
MKLTSRITAVTYTLQKLRMKTAYIVQEVVRFDLQALDI